MPTLKLSQGAPGRKLSPPGSPGRSNSAVDLQRPALSKHAKSHNLRLSTIFSALDRKHSLRPNLRQMDPLHSPPWQT